VHKQEQELTLNTVYTHRANTSRMARVMTAEDNGV